MLSISFIIGPENKKNIKLSFLRFEPKASTLIDFELVQILMRVVESFRAVISINSHATLVLV